MLEERKGLGRVIARIPKRELPLVEHMRSIHRARIILGRGKICREASCLSDVAGLVKNTGIEEYLVKGGSFAVRTTRVGSHEYSSIQVSRVVGASIIEVVEERRGFRPTVNLDYPSVIISVDVIHDEVIVGLELGGDLSWHRRGYRVYNHPAALKPTLAYAMIVLSGARDGDTLLDPMCGGGTIPIEAAFLFEESRLYCSDINPVHIAGARINAAAALVDKRIEFMVIDATMMSGKMRPVDAIVSNPPYGIRYGSPAKVREVYRKFVGEATKIARKTITLISPDHSYLKSLLEENGWRIKHDRRVQHGGLHAHIIVAVP